MLTRMDDCRTQIWVLRSRLEKQPTDLAAARQYICYFGDRSGPRRHDGPPVIVAYASCVYLYRLELSLTLANLPRSPLTSHLSPPHLFAAVLQTSMLKSHRAPFSP